MTNATIEQRRAALSARFPTWVPRVLDGLLADGAALTVDDVIGACRDKLARFKVPKQVRFVGAGDLPTTPKGKVQKFRLVTERIGEP